LSERAVTHRYQDPLDVVWLGTAEALGLRVSREQDVYASTDGRGTLFIGPDGALDADDCLAQMVLHEICHWLVMGADSYHRPDWGLDNETDRDRALEHACLRAQAALLGPLGLRHVFAPTTDYRQFYDSLGPDPFALPAGAEDDGSVVRGRVALARSRQKPWAPHLAAALEATASIVQATARVTTPGAKNASPSSVHSLYARATARAVPHPLGFFADPVAGRSCGDCGWYVAPTSGAERSHCRQAERRADATWPSCERFESSIDCLTCGACCREAYDVVAVSRRDPALKKHTSLMVLHDGSAEVRRDRGRCAALAGGKALPPVVQPPGEQTERPEPPLYAPSTTPFTCDIYADRPRTCRDFQLGGEHCLSARRRVGLSR
jgi:hypothetical protein